MQQTSCGIALKGKSNEIVVDMWVIEISIIHHFALRV